MAAKFGTSDIDRQAAPKDREKLCFYCPASYPANYSSCPRCQLPLVFPSIGRTWVVEGLLGRGGMGAVFAAHHMSDPHRKAAVKVLVPIPGEQLADRRDRIGRFHREALALRRLTHENIVQLYDFARERDGSLYLAMERLDGPTLSMLVKREGPLPVEQAVGLLLPVLSAVAAAHKVGVIHRDLKPENIVLANLGHGATRRQIIKVVDFGVARLAGDTFTRTGQALGTPVYMPPEQANGTDIDERVDIYGAGAVFYELLSGRAPFTAPDAPNANLAVLAMVVTTEPRPPRELRPDLPPALEAVVLRAMRRNREERFKSAGAFAAGIEEAMRHPSRVSWTPPLSAQTPRPLSAQTPPSADMLTSLGQDSLQPRGASPHMQTPQPLRRALSADSPSYGGPALVGNGMAGMPPLSPPPPGQSTQNARAASSLGVKLLVAALYLVVVGAIAITLLLDRLSLRPRTGAPAGSPGERRLEPAEEGRLGAAPEGTEELQRSTPDHNDRGDRDDRPRPGEAGRPQAPTQRPAEEPPRTERVTPAEPPRAERGSTGEAERRAQPGPAALTVSCSPDMVAVPAGCFVMGSDAPDADPDERPAHEVCLSRGYCLDRTEVTNSDYRGCVKDGRCRALGQDFKQLHRSDFNGDAQPVVLVSWTDAHRYCMAQSKRLPSEAEWEHAARGAEGRRYPFGNEEPECSVAAIGAAPQRCRGMEASCRGSNRCQGKNPAHPVAVGTRPRDRSPYGALDLGGNVAEWVADFYGYQYYARSPRLDPAGPTEGRERVFRGGAFSQMGAALRATFRKHGLITSRGDITLGFRCAK